MIGDKPTTENKFKGDKLESTTNNIVVVYDTGFYIGDADGKGVYVYTGTKNIQNTLSWQCHTRNNSETTGKQSFDDAFDQDVYEHMSAISKSENLPFLVTKNWATKSYKQTEFNGSNWSDMKLWRTQNPKPIGVRAWQTHFGSLFYKNDPLCYRFTSEIRGYIAVDTVRKASLVNLQSNLTLLTNRIKKLFDSLTPDEYEQIMTSFMQYITSADIVVNIPDIALDAIYTDLKKDVDNGEHYFRNDPSRGFVLRTLFETGRTSGTNEISDRKRHESRLFGYKDKDTYVWERPKYGTLNIHRRDRPNDLTALYGTTYITLKDHVKKFATITFGDSFGGGGLKAYTLEHSHAIFANQIKFSDDELRYTLAMMPRLDFMKSMNDTLEKWKTPTKNEFLWREIQIHCPIWYGCDVKSIHTPTAESDNKHNLDKITGLLTTLKPKMGFDINDVLPDGESIEAAATNITQHLTRAKITEYMHTRDTENLKPGTNSFRRLVLNDLGELHMSHALVNAIHNLIYPSTTEAKHIPDIKTYDQAVREEHVEMTSTEADQINPEETRMASSRQT